MVDRFGRDNVAVELTYTHEPVADERYEALAQLADQAHLPIVATTAAHIHAPPRHRLASVLAAVRARSSLDDLDGWLPAWASARLRDHDDMATRIRRYPHAVDAAAELGAELPFDLQLIAPALPPLPVPPGYDEMAYLRELTYAAPSDGTGRAARAPTRPTGCAKAPLRNAQRGITTTLAAVTTMPKTVVSAACPVARSWTDWRTRYARAGRTTPRRRAALAARQSRTTSGFR
jgi:DNA polymerase III alpha subunit